MKTILAALDLEGDSEAVLMRALQLAQTHSAELVLLHVLEAGELKQTATAYGCAEDGLRNLLERQAREALDTLLDGLAHPALQVEFGPAHVVIGEVAAAIGADLVVMGPGNRARMLKGRALGTTVDRVVRSLSVPLLVVRSLPELPYRHLTAAVDFSPQSTAALHAARRVAPSAALRLVHVVHVPEPFQQAMLRAGASHADIESFRTGLYDKARDDLAALAGTLDEAGRVVTRVIKNEPGAALLRMSKGPRADLIAVGTDGRGAVRSALLGRVTRRLLSEAGCDVLVGR